LNDCCQIIVRDNAAGTLHQHQFNALWRLVISLQDKQTLYTL